MHNIIDFGAVGDGVTVNTEAIQAAINAGGTVYIPEGVFVTGTVHLKSGGGLYLDHGAVLLASHDRADYNAVDYCSQNMAFYGENMIGTHLISAVEQSDVFIAGFGRIDGDSHYWVNEKRLDRHGDFYAMPPLEDNRPGQMIFFAECRGVRVQDVRLCNSPFWHLFFHGCEDVQVRGISICGERRQWTNDGIDIDCCKRVTVSDCLIDTGDDAITLRAYAEPLLHSDGICEDVVISNCVLTSYLDYGVRIGVGSGKIRNCMLSNLVIKDSLNGIGITCRYLPKNAGGASVENIRFQNISVTAHSAFELRMSANDSHPPFQKHTYMKNVSFENLTAYFDRTAFLLGFENATVSDICFRNMFLHFSSEDPQNDRYRCNWPGFEKKQAAFYVRSAERVRFEGVRFEYEGDCPRGVLAENCRDVKIDGVE